MRYMLLFDMGLPMIFPAMYVMTLALGPIVIIEAFAMRKLGLTLERTLVSSAVANIVSTAAGIPVTWVLLFVLQMITGFGLQTLFPNPVRMSPFWDTVLGVIFHSPWIPPLSSERVWVVPACGMVLLVPFFFASWLAEYQVVKAIAKKAMPGSVAPEEIPAKIKRAVRNANLVSYALLEIFLVIVLVISLYR